MAWIKRNLLFVIGGLLSLGLLGTAGFYNYQGWSRNSKNYNKLNEIYGTLRNLTSQKLSPGNDRVDNIKAAKEQEVQVREWIRRAVNFFEPIPPIPDTDTNSVSSAEFAGTLRRTIDQLQREAERQGVTLPPKYNFSFEAQRSLVKFAPGSLGALAVQFGEVKAITEVLFAARINALDGIQRIRVSEDDLLGPQSDYFEERSVTNNLGVITPYQISFRSFTPEIAHVLAGFASSSHGFVVKSINVQPAGGAAMPSSGPMQPMPVPGMIRQEGKVNLWLPMLATTETAAPVLGQAYLPPMLRARPAAPSPPPAMSPAAPSPAVTGRSGLQTVLNEQLLRVTLVVEIVKLLPQK
jgi:hypothetical protein